MNDKIKQRTKAEKLLDEVKDLIRELEEYSDSLRKANEELQSEHYKDKELSKLKHQLQENKDNLEHGFPLTKEEAAAIEKWKDNHIKIKHSGAQNMRWGFTYEFYPTSSRIFGTCCCISCMNKAKAETTIDSYVNNVSATKERELINKYDAKFEF